MSKLELLGNKDSVETKLEQARGLEIPENHDPVEFADRISNFAAQNPQADFEIYEKMGLIEPVIRDFCKPHIYNHATEIRELAMKLEMELTKQLARVAQEAPSKTETKVELDSKYPDYLAELKQNLTYAIFKNKLEQDQIPRETVLFALADQLYQLKQDFVDNSRQQKEAFEGRRDAINNKADTIQFEDALSPDGLEKSLLEDNLAIEIGLARETQAKEHLKNLSRQIPVLEELQRELQERLSPDDEPSIAKQKIESIFDSYALAEIKKARPLSPKEKQKILLEQAIAATTEMYWNSERQERVDFDHPLELEEARERIKQVVDASLQIYENETRELIEKIEKRYAKELENVTEPKTKETLEMQKYNLLEASTEIMLRKKLELNRDKSKDRDKLYESVVSVFHLMQKMINSYYRTEVISNHMLFGLLSKDARTSADQKMEAPNKTIVMKS